MNVNIIEHPLIAHKLTIMRNKNTGSKDFRELLNEISMLMGYEITRDLKTVEIDVETPLVMCKSKVILGKKLAIVPILRAGLSMVDGLLKLVPVAKVGHIGIYRDPETLEPVEYYCKLPDDIQGRTIILADPMLATGQSAVMAISLLKEKGCQSIKLMSLIASPQGIEAVSKSHPDVKIYLASVDEGLDENAYITPGLGDAGDRLFGTK